MRINHISSVDINIRKTMLLEMQKCLKMKNLPFVGVKDVIEEDETIIVYSLLPTLESFQVIKKINKDGTTQVYMTKNSWVAEIKEESLNEFLTSISAINDLANDNTTLENMVHIPLEIKYNQSLINKISFHDQLNKVEELYQKFAMTISQMRKIQFEYWNARNKEINMNQEASDLIVSR